MRKNSTYMDRAMRSSDPRYRRILGKLGYTTRVVKPDVELKNVRAEYEEVFGKKPFHGWSIEVLREKIGAEIEAKFKKADD